VSTRAKAFVAGIDALIMGAFAFSETAGSFEINAAALVLWGAVVAAAVCAVVVLQGGAAVIAWAAIGYVLFGASHLPSRSCRSSHGREARSGSAFWSHRSRRLSRERSSA
jgi:hypothetical protein